MNRDTKKRLQMNHYDDLKIVVFKIINIYLLAKFEKDFGKSSKSHIGCTSVLSVYRVNFLKLVCMAFVTSRSVTS